MITSTDARSPEERLFISRAVSYLEKLKSLELFSGMVLFAIGKEVIVLDVIRPKSLNQKPFDPTTPFCVFSCGKAFTAISFLQIMEKGVVSLHEPISTLLDDNDLRLVGADPMYTKEVPSDDDLERLKRSSVTALHLLTHSSGLWKPDDRVVFDEKRVGVRDHESYSNYGFRLVARIVAKKSGIPFQEYVKNHIFQPVGMQSALVCNTPQQIAFLEKNIDMFQVFPSGRFISVEEIEPGYRVPPPDGNGCFWMTIGDYFAFVQAFLDHALLQKASEQLMTTAHVAQQGLGVKIENEDPLVFGHYGLGTGASSFWLVIKTKTPMTLITLSNVSSGMNVIPELGNALLGKTVEPLQEMQVARMLYSRLKECTPLEEQKIREILGTPGSSSVSLYTIYQMAIELERDGKKALAAQILSLYI